MDELVAPQAPGTLSQATLHELPETVLKPRYDRAALSAGIVHIGVGNFHRAHQAWYLHRLMQDGKAHNWAILGAGVRSYDSAMREQLIAQDCLTTLIELSPDHANAEIIGSMIDYVPVEEDNAALIKALSDPSIRIVSMTVTEGGYYRNPATGAFDPTRETIVHDAANPLAPKTAFGAIIAALKIRRDRGATPFTVLSCDNLQGNGDIARQTIVGLAALSDPKMAAWIDETVVFPNSMVDCIVPATGAQELAMAHRWGVHDAAPVTHENFRQWVIEDKFCAGRPDWDQVGATFTDNVHAYEAMKLRVLNAGHQML
ncbi:MAG: mannitol dehydrogenase family protein, partial [Devosiaceae bacterium]|nr:mannitol dehydrogenase family protein [Devosiaceae bacterium MH13]